MDPDLLLVFLCIFFIIGGGGTLFWKLRQDKVTSTRRTSHAQTHQLQTHQLQTRPLTQNAILTEWSEGECQTLSGTCGKGEVIHTRSCLREGTGNGKRCSDYPLEKKSSCYVQCPRPNNVVDWGHSNDAAGIPLGAPKKGWYDVSGQGQPNDYCRYVGEPGKIFWACHVEKEPYVKMDPSHLSFSGGPSNKEIPFVPHLVRKMCPDHNVYETATDPDLQKSIANGFFARCGAKCVYDHRNPKSGWTFDGGWQRIDDMSIHACGTLLKDEMRKSIDRYESIYDVKNAWSGIV